MQINQVQTNQTQSKHYPSTFNVFQPMNSEANTYILVYNRSLFNINMLQCINRRRRHVQQGHLFMSFKCPKTTRHLRNGQTRVSIYVLLYDMTSLLKHGDYGCVPIHILSALNQMQYYNYSISNHDALKKYVKGTQMKYYFWFTSVYLCLSSQLILPTTSHCARYEDQEHVYILFPTLKA